MRAVLYAYTGIATLCKRTTFLKFTLFPNLPSQRGTIMSSTMSILKVLVKNNVSSQLLVRPCARCESLRARLQSFVLVLELLDKMAGLLFAVLVGAVEFCKFSSPAFLRSLFLIRTASAKSGRPLVGPVGP